MLLDRLKESVKEESPSLITKLKESLDVEPVENFNAMDAEMINDPKP